MWNDTTLGYSPCTFHKRPWGLVNLLNLLGVLDGLTNQIIICVVLYSHQVIPRFQVSIYWMSVKSFSCLFESAYKLETHNINLLISGCLVEVIFLKEK